MAKKINIPKHKEKSKLDSYIEQSSENLVSDHDKYLSFSFKYLNHTDKFPTHFEDHAYLPTLMQRLADISKMKRIELIKDNSKSLRCHLIDWEKENVSELSFGLKNEEQLVHKPYQFQVSANAYGRVHGFFISEVFYVRWLDPHHNLYEGD